jgi:dye decolorizing peroxidase
MTNSPRGRVSRRALLRTGGGAAAAFGLGAGAVVAAPHLIPDRPTEPASLLEPFFGPHQAGVLTGRQSSAAFAAFHLRPGLRTADASRMMRLVTDDAARLTQAQPALGDQEPDLARHAARLTVTFGFGPRWFGKLGLSSQQPAGFRDLPAFPIDRLQDRFSGGDLLLQIGADDPMVVAHALRQLTKTLRTFAERHWVQRGFTSAPGGMVRNLMGLVDGSSNPRPPEADFDRLVWSAGAPDWFAGGTMLVFRRIAMTLSTWDELDTAGKELAVGRRIADGAPLSGQGERDEPDLTAVDQSGLPLIPAFSHVARAKARSSTERFLRRSYSYDDGHADDEDTGTGLLFAAYQADIETQYLPVQQRLAQNDAMNAWTVPLGSAVFALPPGCAPDGYIGESLLT